MNKNEFLNRTILSTMIALSIPAGSQTLALTDVPFKSFPPDTSLNVMVLVDEASETLRIPTDDFAAAYASLYFLFKLPNSIGKITHFAISPMRKPLVERQHIAGGSPLWAGPQQDGVNFFATPLCSEGMSVRACGKPISAGEWLYAWSPNDGPREPQPGFFWKYGEQKFNLYGNRLRVSSLSSTPGELPTGSTVEITRLANSKTHSPGRKEWLRIDLGKPLQLEPFKARAITTIWVQQDPNGKLKASLSPNDFYAPDQSREHQRLTGDVIVSEGQIQIRVEKQGDALFNQPRWLGRKPQGKLELDLRILTAQRQVVVNGGVQNLEFVELVSEALQKTLPIKSITQVPASPAGLLFRQGGYSCAADLALVGVRQREVGYVRQEPSR